MGRIFPFKCIGAAILVRKKNRGERKNCSMLKKISVIDKMHYYDNISDLSMKENTIILNNWRFNTKKKE